MAPMSASEPVYVEAWGEATDWLRSDSVFGNWVEEIGPVLVPEMSEEPFYYLARTICYQQLAGNAAATIHGRFCDALDGDVCPEAVLRAPQDELRAAGLSRNKLKAIRDLAEKIHVGDVVVDDLHEQDDDEVVRRLTTVWGVGVWTARMYLMFRLRRPDVWPVGDLGVRAGFARAHGLDSAPTARELEPLGERYRPWRSAVAWYCWRVLETELP
ncbi:MAG: DNA-3-methyladenine glycosylase 2 family protein [Gemmatimonadota bacterium]|nr:DNA-3-methyladenine glycosylase 2 family protein [Gemmatimonadota bacterium]